MRKTYFDCRLQRGADTKAQSYLKLHSLDEPLTYMCPQSITNRDLELGLEVSAEIAFTADDEIDYIPGLNAHVNIFLAWWRAKHGQNSPDTRLHIGIDHIQRVLDELPPALRWRGALSRDPRTTHGHEAQMVNILIASLYIKSNFLQHFPSSSLPHLNHRVIIRCVLVLCGNLSNFSLRCAATPIPKPIKLSSHASVLMLIFGFSRDVVEIFRHFPPSAKDANRHRFINMSRDMGAAYIEELRSRPRIYGPAESATDQNLTDLLEQLDKLERSCIIASEK